MQKNRQDHQTKIWARKCVRLDLYLVVSNKVFFEQEKILINYLTGDFSCQKVHRVRLSQSISQNLYTLLTATRKFGVFDDCIN